MNFISRLFRKPHKFLPLLKELEPELSKRYGTSKDNYKGQIDRITKEIGISEELIPYAYVMSLRDEDYAALTKDSPIEWKLKEQELQDFIDSQPRSLGSGNFYESGKGDPDIP